MMMGKMWTWSVQRPIRIEEGGRESTTTPKDDGRSGEN